MNIQRKQAYSFRKYPTRLFSTYRSARISGLQAASACKAHPPNVPKKKKKSPR